MKLFLLSFTCLALTGCVYPLQSSFQARPTAVLEMKAIVNQARKYDVETVNNDINQMTATEAQVYRNKVISAYMGAIDARYHNFVTALSVNKKATDTALGLTVVGVSAAGSVVTGQASQILSAVGALAEGSKLTLNESLYYEKTIPAIIATMDAERDLVRETELIKKLGNSISVFPMEAAFAALASYENAASVDGAIERLNALAAKDKSEATKGINFLN